jgi:hypothetical protein
MKIKNKIFTLLSVFTLVGLTHSLTLKELNASLTAPTTYNINYSWDSASLRQELGTSSIGGPAPVYTRTASGSFFNYTTTINNSTHSSILPYGLEITMIFNHSNTNWTSVSGGYVPTENKIGSNNTVGSTSRKWYFKYDNQTNKDYKIFLDFSSTADINRVYHLYINGQVYINNLDNNRLYYVDANKLFQVWLPAFSYVEFFTENNASNTNYFDSWYLQDLGFNTAYSNGYDFGQAEGYSDGYADGLGNNPNILLNGFQAMVGILVNFMLMILNLEVFNVSIMSVFGILALFVGVIWILKIVRG